ncbi:hypothetical protein FDUTEX481_00490 [Tolypothrix sp. PCC 7601]|nr:hypothetical protein FDUTEX481_00490 [Tolypothrix sp. PCC 7601]
MSGNKKYGGRGKGERVKGCNGKKAQAITLSNICWLRGKRGMGKGK